jgi:hypothetical protein
MSTTPTPATARTATPYSINDLHDLNIVLDIFRGLEHRLSVVETIAKFHGGKIEQLIQWTIALPNIEKEVAQNSKDLKELGPQHNKDLNELGKRLEKDVNALGGRHDKDIKELEKIAHTASTFGRIAIVLIASSVALAIAILTFLYHHLVFK